MIRFFHFTPFRSAVSVTKSDRILEILSLCLLIVIIALTIVFYRGAPERIPIHFNFSGEADGWGGRGFYLIISLTGIIIMGVCNWGAYHYKMLNLPSRLNPARLVQQIRWIGHMMRTLSVLFGLLFITILFMMALPQLGVSLAWFDKVFLFWMPVISLVLFIYTLLIWKAGK